MRIDFKGAGPMGYFAQTISFLGMAFFLVSCQSSATSKEPSHPTTADSPEADLRMDVVKMQFYGINGLQWELRSPVATTVTRENKITAKKPVISMFQEGTLSTTIRSESGFMNSATNKPGTPPAPPIGIGSVALEAGDAYLVGNVVAVSTTGTTLETEWVHYKSQVDLIVSTAPVKLTRDDSITTGIGMEASSDLNRVRIFNQKVIFWEKSQ
jgi:lipopolysaccharide export system protein LptC